MTSYFTLRKVSPEDYASYTIPAWLKRQLDDVPADSRVLDFGCGFGQVIQALKAIGYTRVEGVDIEPEALAHCRSGGYLVHDFRQSKQFLDANRAEFDLIITQHVLEHIPKSEVITVLMQLRELLSPRGKIVVAVPNAQAFTGAYWAYEDFTHHTLYTSGSIYYVLRAAGFSEVQFLDIDCTTGAAFFRTAIRRAVSRLFSAYYAVMCRLLDSPTHRHSPNIFSYEIKVVAR